MQFIYGKEGFLINQEVNRLIRGYKIEPIIYSSGEPLEDILLDISTASMFSEEKLVIIKNHPAFIKDKGVDDFLDGLKDTQTKIIFSLEADKIDKKNKLVKYLLENYESKEFKAIDSKTIVKTIKTIVESKGGTIDYGALIQLANKLPEDLRIIVSEVEKLLLENNIITKKMVDTSIGEYLKDDYYALSNALSSNDAIGILRAYNSKKSSGEDSMILISQISSTLSLALTVSSYRKQGLSNQDISDKMRIHIFRVKRAGDLLSASSHEQIQILINSLADLEADIKTGKIDSEHGVEVYLLKLIK